MGNVRNNEYYLMSAIEALNMIEMEDERDKELIMYLIAGINEVLDECFKNRYKPNNVKYTLTKRIKKWLEE